jgi:ribosomal-protein-serine acetyltransferase
MLEERHADEAFTLVDRNRAYLGRWLPWVQGTRTTADTLSFIRLCQREAASNAALALGIFVDGTYAGQIGYHQHDWRNAKSEIGYWLAEPLQGQGIVTGCCRALVDYGFETLGLHRIEIRCAVDNQASRRVPERLGFFLEGIARGAHLLGDRFVDVLVFSQLAGDGQCNQSVS